MNTPEPAQPTDEQIRAAVEADIQQYFTNSLTPDRGYATPIDNVKALFTRAQPAQEERKDDGWQMLEVGEVIQEGDEYRSGRGWLAIAPATIGAEVLAANFFRRRISQPQGGEPVIETYVIGPNEEMSVEGVGANVQPVAPTPVPHDLEALAGEVAIKVYLNRGLGAEPVILSALRLATEPLVKERDAEREELEQLRHEKQQANSPMFSRRELLDNIARLTAELARVKEEATENHRMWEHWQNKAVEAQGDLSRESQVAQAYHNAFDEAIRQRDTALAERDAITVAARQAEVALVEAADVRTDTRGITMKTGTQLITEERERQVSQEQWTPGHDDTHDKWELARAARCYALPGVSAQTPPRPDWPWDNSWWKPASFPIRNLVKAGALIAAEIDRLQRASQRSETKETR